MKRTLFDKLWQSHVVEDTGDGWSLIHVDRLLLHDLTASDAFGELREKGLKPANPELVYVTPDHAVSSLPGRSGTSSQVGRALYKGMRQGALETGVQLFDIGSGDQGIVHVIGPELGIVLPGLSMACGDSHTCTNGALGALAIGIGSSEGVHALATQTLRLQKPKNMRVNIEGKLRPGVTPKDVVIHVIRQCGVAGGLGHAVEYAGQVIRDMDVEGRLTVCNMAIEMGARYGVIAPDERTVAYVRGRRYAPAAEIFDASVSAWKALPSDEGAVFDKEVTVDVSSVRPMITWGTNPEQAIAVNERLPDLADFAEGSKRSAASAAFDYMGLVPGLPIAGTPIDWVFIGSCNNGRLSDLVAAAQVVYGKRVANGVHAWVVPGSESVKRQAELDGLDKIFRDAGFEWREPGCSMCAASNGEQVPPEARCVSTSNRNFMGRQGPRARTHLASPAIAAAAAIAGRIVELPAH